MSILDDLRAEWIAMTKSLGDHIAYLEAGIRDLTIPDRLAPAHRMIPYRAEH